MYTEFIEEVSGLRDLANKALRKILLSEDRMSKHPPYTWKTEPQNEHLFKAIGHISRYMILRDGLKPDDGEDHLSLAITRLIMAAGVESNNPEGKHVAASRGYEYHSNFLMNDE